MSDYPYIEINLTKAINKATDTISALYAVLDFRKRGSASDTEFMQIYNMLATMVEDGKITPMQAVTYAKSCYDAGAVTVSQFRTTYCDINVAFADLSWDDVFTITGWYYDGVLTLSNIQMHWKAGDSKTMAVSAMSATYVGESHSAQNVTLKIVDFNHDTLVTSVGGKSQAFMTLGFMLNEQGYMKNSRTTTGGWAQSERRNWANNVCLYALPSVMQSNLKPVYKYSDSGNINGQGTSVTTTDSVFIPTMKEFTGSNSYPTSGSVSSGQGGIGGTQYTLFASTTNRQMGKTYWTASTGSVYWSGGSKRYSETFAYINTSGVVATQSTVYSVSGNSAPSSSNNRGLFMCFCI